MLILKRKTNKGSENLSKNPSRKLRSFFILFFFIAGGFLFAGNVYAATYYWVGGTTNSNTSNTANWKTTAGACADSANVTAPTTGDTVRFVSNCLNSATIDSALSVTNFYIDNGHSASVTTASTTLAITGILNVTSGTLTITNGGIMTTGSIDTNIYSGAINVDGPGARWTSTGKIVVSTGSTAALNVLNGAVVTTTGAAETNASGGTITVDGAGSILNANGRSYSSGNTNILNGGVMKTGLTRYYSGTVTIDGAGSLWSESSGGDDFRAGYSGGTMFLNITNGGQLTRGWGLIEIGHNSNGTVIVDGVDSKIQTNSGIYIGEYGGTGTLTLKNGAIAKAGSDGTGTVTLANAAGSKGTLNLGSGSSSGTIQASTVTGDLGSSTLNFYHTDSTYDFTPSITGALKVTHTGSGTTTLTGTNTYTGTTTLSSGTLITNNSSALGTGSLTQDGGSFSATGNLTIGGSVAINSGTFTSSSGTLSVAGNWSNSGTFVHNGGTVNLNGTNQTITGANIFNNFTITAPNTVTFPSNTTQTFAGAFTALGTSGNAITIKAGTPGSVATLSGSGTANGDYLSLSDSTAIGTALWHGGSHSTGTNFSGWLEILPVLTETAPIGFTNDTTPSYVFSSTKSGTLLYTGSCTPGSTSISSGTNTITFNTLSEGTYTDCKISVIDSLGNDSATTTLASFTIDTTAPSSFTTSSPANESITNGMATFSWNASSDSGSGLSKYTLFVDDSINTDDIDSNITSVSSSVNLSCVTHTWFVRTTDKAGNTIDSSTSSFKVGCGSGGSFGGSVGGSISAGGLNSTVPAPRYQTVYPDGRVVYLDTPSSQSSSGPTVTTPSASSQGSSGPSASTASAFNPSSGASSGPSAGTPTAFSKPLPFGSTSQDIIKLQTFLASDKTIYPRGLITGYFGPLTKSAVLQFQLKYEIVSSPKDPGAGNFGPKTRGKVNEVMGRIER